MRLAVLSDIHGNLPALERAFDFIDKINVDGIIWCGDYITDILLSSEVLEFVRLKNKQYNHWIIKGNREDYIIDYYKGVYDNFDFIDVTGSLLLTYKSLSESDIKFISSLPDEVVIDIDGLPQIYVSHKLKSNTNYSYNIFGHIHKQCLFVKDDHKFINPGSIGMCASGMPGVEFAIMESIDGEWSTNFYHMSYNLEYVIKYISSSELSKCKYHWSDILIRTLKTGNDYIDCYVDSSKKVAIKCGIDVKKLSDIPQKVWDFVYDRLDKFKK